MLDTTKLSVLCTGAILIAAIATGITVIDHDRLTDEMQRRDKAFDIVEGRLITLEAHFVGHTVKLAKNGNGIIVEPCMLNVDQDCMRDDTGISISQVIVMGMKGTGIKIEDNGIPKLPKREETKGQIDMQNSTIDGIPVDNYQGPYGWRWKLYLVAGRKARFSCRRQ